MTCFVDTSVFYGALDTGDAHHDQARAVLAPVLEQREEVLTHSYVVVETTALLQRRIGLEAVRRFHQELLPACSVVFVDEAVHRAALTVLFATGRRDLSLVDCVSFEVMRREGIEVAFAIDHHFAEQGFTVRP